MIIIQTYQQKLLKQANWIGRVALTEYQKNLNWHKPTDYQLMCQEIKNDLSQHDITKSFYLPVALKYYQTKLQHQFEEAILAEDLNHANQSNSIELIESLFQFRIV